MIHVNTRWPAVLLPMLSLSIGWGIRGNFGHEAGAMLPGALCALAVCLFSGREDWRARAPYFAMFGALGWAFGGSIAYMPPLGYTHSGHWPTQVYGYLAMFVMGFLWAGMGGAGTAYAATEERGRLAAIFKPLCFIFALWAAQYFWQDDFTAWYERARGAASSDGSDFRQRDPFYWLDSEWVEALLALVGLCAFDLWERRFRGAWKLIPFAAGGAAAGFGVQRALEALGWLAPLLALVVHPQGDPALHDPAQMLYNFPQVFFDLAAHMGWMIGAAAGAAVYFRRYGRWGSGSSLLLHITLGSLAVFLMGPVLLSSLLRDFGGFRLMPPRGDSWANILGAFIGMAIYMRRNGLLPVAQVAVISGVLGGLALPVAQFVKQLAFMVGNPVITTDAATVERWAHWHKTNWHSLVTEQGVGLLYGLAIALPMAALAARLSPHPDAPREGRWTAAFACFFTLNVITYINLVKNVNDWTREQAGGFRAVPAVMKAPLLGYELSALAWFNIVFLMFAVATALLLRAQLRRPLAMVPASWLGRGQLLYVVLLWIMVIGNFERALVHFAHQRLVTEAVIFVNALIATYLLLACGREEARVAAVETRSLAALTRRTVLAGVGALCVLTVAFTGVVQAVYGDKHDGWGRRNLRLGPEADWRIHPILKDKRHF
ncbi:MAG: hypothetical protein HZB13_03605 [Acidobacteria bacterium]|nr:hypothetical protein [Acidobacteriota bacterium]